MRFFFIRSWAAISTAHGPMWPKLDLCPDLLVFLVTCKNEEDPIENESVEWPQDNMLIFLALKGR